MLGCESFLLKKKYSAPIEPHAAFTLLTELYSPNLTPFKDDDGLLHHGRVLLPCDMENTSVLEIFIVIINPSTNT